MVEFSPSRCLPLAVAPQSAIYVDGDKTTASLEAGTFHLNLPVGRHVWQLTRRLPTPLPPVILRTENRAAGAKVIFAASASATKYRLEVSANGGNTWSPVGTTSAPAFDIPNLINGTKVHVRVVALNDDGESAPSDEYPVYVTDASPLPPDGLQLVPAADTAALRWGEVLGVSEYRLYVRKRGETPWQLIYHGPARQYADKRPGIVPPFAAPGSVANQLYAGPAYPAYEYAVSAVNGNGESETCRPVNTDPTNWLNWDPQPGEGYRRTLNYNITPFVPADSTPPHYPR